MNQSIHRTIRHKVGLLNLAEELGNISKAYKMMGVSRDRFYCYQAAQDEGGIEALFEKSKWKPIHGDNAYTVPLFGGFVKRVMPTLER